MKKLLIFDTNAIMHHVYHGYKKSPVYNRAGDPVFMLKGFVNYINYAIELHDPDYTLFVFDPDGSTFRHDIYPLYKANRPKKEDDFISQVSLIKEYLTHSGYPTITMPGFEGDDVIATIAKRASKSTAFDSIIIYTGDKDIYQILDEKISVFNLRNKLLVNTSNILSHFPVEHHCVIDYLTLLGDAVDNVKGVNQCGEKTALKLIQRYKSVEFIKDEIDYIDFKSLGIATKIANAITENFKNNYDDILMSKFLITLKLDIEIALTLKIISRSQYDVKTMKDYLNSHSIY